VLNYYLRVTLRCCFSIIYGGSNCDIDVYFCIVIFNLLRLKLCLSELKVWLGGGCVAPRYIAY
jgi:hypothetical protein